MFFFFFFMCNIGLLKNYLRFLKDTYMTFSVLGKIKIKKFKEQRVGWIVWLLGANYWTVALTFVYILTHWRKRMHYLGYWYLYYFNIFFTSLYWLSNSGICIFFYLFIYRKVIGDIFLISLYYENSSSIFWFDSIK